MLLLQISLWHTVCRLCTFNSQAIWKVKAEGKLHFFAWLFVQGKIQTADNLLLKGIHCEPVCCLCAQEMETAVHLYLHCCYAREVWCLVHSWSEGLAGIPVHGVDIQDWWNSTLQITWPGIFGTKGTDEFFRVSHKLQQGFSVAIWRQTCEGWAATLVS